MTEWFDPLCLKMKDYTDKNMTEEIQDMKSYSEKQ